ncbi:MAG: hypothetical protein Q9192_000822 [Flavoplaca navasiana]
MATPESAFKPEDSQISHADALTYWNAVPATTLELSRIDVRGSLNFFRRSNVSTERELLDRGADCGTGIGRVTAGFLSKVCRVLDDIEPVEKFAKLAREMILTGEGRVGVV